MCSKNVASNLELARQLDTLYSKISDTSTVTELIYIVSACCRTELSGVCNPSSQRFFCHFSRYSANKNANHCCFIFTPIIQSSNGKYDPTQQNVFPTIEGSRHLRFRQPLWCFPVSRNFAFKSSTNLPLSTMATPRLYRRTKIWSKFSTWSRNWPRKSGGSQLGFRKNTTGVFSNATLNS